MKQQGWTADHIEEADELAQLYRDIQGMTEKGAHGRETPARSNTVSESRKGHT